MAEDIDDDEIERSTKRPDYISYFDPIVESNTQHEKKNKKTKKCDET